MARRDARARADASPTTSITEAEVAAGRGEPAAAGLAGRAGRRALPGGVLRRGGEAVDPRRPALRRHRRRSAATCSSAAGSASRPPSTSPPQAKAEAAANEILPDPNGPPARRWCRSSRPPATCGRWSAGGTSSAPGPTTSSTWPPRGRPPDRVVVQAVRARHRLEQGIDPFTTRSRRPACITIPLPDDAWRPCNAEVASEGTRHHRRGHRPLATTRSTPS